MHLAIQIVITITFLAGTAWADSNRLERRNQHCSDLHRVCLAGDVYVREGGRWAVASKSRRTSVCAACRSVCQRVPDASCVKPWPLMANGGLCLGPEDREGYDKGTHPAPWVRQIGQPRWNHKGAGRYRGRVVVRTRSGNVTIDVRARRLGRNWEISSAHRTVRGSRRDDLAREVAGWEARRSRIFR